MRNFLLCKNFHLSVFSGCLFVSAVLCVNSPSNKSVSCLTVGNRRFSLSCIQLALNPYIQLAARRRGIVVEWKMRKKIQWMSNWWYLDGNRRTRAHIHTQVDFAVVCCKHKDVLRDDKSKRRLNRTMAHKRLGRQMSADAKVLALRMISMAVDAFAGTVLQALQSASTATVYFYLWIVEFCALRNTELRLSPCRRLFVCAEVNKRVEMFSQQMLCLFERCHCAITVDFPAENSFTPTKTESI